MKTEGREWGQKEEGVRHRVLEGMSGREEDTMGLCTASGNPRGLSWLSFYSVIGNSSLCSSSSLYPFFLQKRLRAEEIPEAHSDVSKSPWDTYVAGRLHDQLPALLFPGLSINKKRS